MKASELCSMLFFITEYHWDKWKNDGKVVLKKTIDKLCCLAGIQFYGHLLIFPQSAIEYN